MTDEALRARVVALVRPTPVDSLRAKRAVLRILDDGAAHRTPALIAAAATDLGADVRTASEPLQLRFPDQVDAAQITPDWPAILFLRAWFAGQWAIADMAARGLIVPALDPGGAERNYDPLAREMDVRMGIVHPRGGTSFDIPVTRPALAIAYVRSTVGAQEPKWFLDPDLFLEDLRTLPLDERAVRTLREALEAFRRGLYLATVALLGVVSEAAWHAAAERLREPQRGGALGRAVEYGATAKVQKRVVDILRAAPDVGTSVDEVYSLAALFRELRNYGVHPARERDDLERYFAEEECGLLILRTHNYLVRLAGLVQKAVDARGSVGA